jgi:hypothetical protein
VSDSFPRPGITFHIVDLPYLIIYNTLRAIQNGATTIAEGFLFFVAAGLIVGESYRGSRSTARRRDDVDEALEALRGEVRDLRKVLDDKLGTKVEDGKMIGKVDMKDVAKDAKDAAREMVVRKDNER